MVPRRAEQQVPARVRRAGEAREVLRQHQDHEERPRLAVLRRQSQVPRRRHGGCWWWGLPRAAPRQCEYIFGRSVFTYIILK